jgi:hypothetical protein
MGNQLNIRTLSSEHNLGAYKKSENIIGTERDSEQPIRMYRRPRTVKHKYEVKLSLCLTKHHAMKTY